MTQSRGAAARRYKVEQNLYATVLVVLGLAKAVRIVLGQLDKIDAGLTLPRSKQ